MATLIKGEGVPGRGNSMLKGPGAAPRNPEKPALSWPTGEHGKTGRKQDEETAA